LKDPIKKDPIKKDSIKSFISNGRQRAAKGEERFEGSREWYWPDSAKSAERKLQYTELQTLAEKSKQSPPNTDYKTFLLEAYKKHSAELASIEDRLNRFLLVILGVFGAGAVAIPKVPVTPWSARILYGVVFLFTAFGLHYNSEIRGVRARVRYLLVRCEIDMGFYTSKERLYTDDELSYPTKGGYLKFTYAAIIVAAAIGLILLIHARVGLSPAAG